MIQALNRIMTLLFPPLVASLLISCASEAPTFYYTLRPIAPNISKSYTSETLSTEKTDITSNISTSVGIGPITFPEWLDQTAVVSYQKNNVLKVPYYQVWAGDLEPMILNVLAANISSMTGQQKVLPFPWDNRHRPHYQIRIHIEEFAGTLGEQARLQVKWTLLADQGKTEKLSRAEVLNINLDDPQYDTYVRALNTLINDFSQQLAEELNVWIKPVNKPKTKL
ncbi:PqiC family protein [Agarilytica rhodophyticola]|uniref:PqiC family protein n=1 Tax=Agarilytica rhodophyticola TaxID=1737490 RepID=UPI000B346E8B|nr:PqiC family protein [Agarilytica rhodophyticola]